MNAALGLILLFVAVAFGLGAWARGGRTMTLEQWSVGGRGFGTLFVFLLMAGEIYTTFTFLGASGWAYGKGAPAFYILCYGALAYAGSYFLLPPIWRHATRHRLHSQADFFARRYGSRSLGVVVALVGFAALLPYVVGVVELDARLREAVGERTHVADRHVGEGWHPGRRAGPARGGCARVGWLGCIEAITPSAAKRGISPGAITCACSTRQR